MHLHDDVTCAIVYNSTRHHICLTTFNVAADIVHWNTLCSAKYVLQFVCVLAAVATKEKILGELQQCISTLLTDHLKQPLVIPMLIILVHNAPIVVAMLSACRRFLCYYKQKLRPLAHKAVYSLTYKLVSCFCYYNTKFRKNFDVFDPCFGGNPSMEVLYVDTITR